MKYITRSFPVPLYKNGQHVICTKYGRTYTGNIINSNRFESGKVEYTIFDETLRKYIDVEEKNVQVF